MYVKRMIKNIEPIYILKKKITDKILGKNINNNETIKVVSSLLFVKFNTSFLKVYKLNNAKKIFILPAYHKLNFPGKNEHIE